MCFVLNTIDKSGKKSLHFSCDAKDIIKKYKQTVSKSTIRSATIVNLKKEKA